MKLFKSIANYCHRIQHHYFVKRITKKLRLNQEQIVALESLIQQLYNSKAAISEKCSGSKNQLLDLLAENHLDRAKAEAMLQTQLADINSHSQAFIVGFADFFDNLADNQRQQLHAQLQACSTHRCRRCY